MSGSVEVLRNQTLIQILPYIAENKKPKEIRNALKEYKILTDVLLKVVQAFQNGELEKFDALVGENACETRALKTALIASRHFTNLDPAKITVIQERIVELISLKPQHNHSQYNVNSLKELLDKENLDISLTSEEVFLVQAYLLYSAKKDKKEELCLQTLADPKELTKSDPKELLKLGEMTSKFADKLVRKLKLEMSTDSVGFVREQAASLKNEGLIKMSGEEFTYKHNGAWPCTPMFWTYQVLLKMALREKIPLVVHVILRSEDKSQVVGEEYMLFDPDAEGKEYVQVDLQQKDLTRPAFVVQGLACIDPSAKDEWKSRMAKHSITDVIYAGAADHRQYPDPSQDRRIDELQDEEYKKYKELAKSEGFSLENPTTFFIQHVYAAQIKNVYKRPQVTSL